MSDEIALVSTFANEDACARGIEALHAAHAHDFRAFMPFPSEKVQEAADEARGHGRSPVRLWVLIGGITGFLTAVVLTVGTSLEWNLNVGGRAVASIPPYVVIMFELMILFGGISGVTGFFFHSQRPVFDPDPGYHPDFSADKFGLVVRCAENEVARLESMLLEAGAEEVERRATAAPAHHGH
jgi:hypothetical protein